MRSRAASLVHAHARIGEAAAARDYVPPPGTSPQHGDHYLARYGLTHLLRGERL